MFFVRNTRDHIPLFEQSKVEQISGAEIEKKNEKNIIIKKFLLPPYRCVVDVFVIPLFCERTDFVPHNGQNRIRISEKFQSRWNVQNDF